MKNFFSDRKVLVTGAGGFIGSHICEELVEKGAIVTAVIRDKSKTENLKNVLNKIVLTEANLANKHDVASLIKNQSIVIHAAAVDGGTRFKSENASRIFHENVHMTMNIFEALKKSSVEKLLYVSSAEVYSNLENKDSVKEEHFSLFSPAKPEQWYAFSKMIGEYTAQLVGNALGIKVIIARPANIYGPRDSVQKSRLVPTIMHALKEGKKHIELGGTGNDIRSFMYVRDYVKNLLQLIEHSDGGIYNFAGTKPIRIEEFVKLFADSFGATVTFTEKHREKGNKENRFLLDSSKAKKTIPTWHDSPYQQRIKEMIEKL